MRTLLGLAIGYTAAFAILVVAGHEKEWTGEYGFIYAQDEDIDNLLGKIFEPAYSLAKPMGIVRLSHPQRSL